MSRWPAYPGMRFLKRLALALARGLAEYRELRDRDRAAANAPPRVPIRREDVFWVHHDPRKGDE